LQLHFNHLFDIQASQDFIDPRKKSNASKIVRLLESCSTRADARGGSGTALAAASSGVDRLSLTTTPSGEGRRPEFNMLTKELQATCNTLTSNMRQLVDRYSRTRQGIVMTSANLMALCLCALGASELSRGDTFNSREMSSLLDTLVMMRPHFPIAYCVSLPLPGVLGQETLNSLNGNGRATEWMPSFMCLPPMACKAQASWTVPTANFDFHCNHAGASRSSRLFCAECKSPLAM
jgi:hypothetical protein